LQLLNRADMDMDTYAQNSCYFFLSELECDLTCACTKSHRELANTFLIPGSFYYVAYYFMITGE